MLRKGYGGLYKAPTKEERRKRTAERRERSDQVYCSFVPSSFSPFIIGSDINRLRLVTPETVNNRECIKSS